MKAQGLPINFIVIAALAILILILAAGFVVAGGSSFGRAVSPETMRSSCQTWCNDLESYTTNNVNTAPASGEAISGPTGYCSKNLAVKGIGSGTCGDLEDKLGVSCYVTFEDGSSCRVSCNATTNTPTCE